MILGFSYFSPYSGEMPENTASQEHGIFKRAQSILQSRNAAECEEIIGVVNLVLESLPSAELMLQHLERTAQLLDGGVDDEPLYPSPGHPTDDDESGWLCWASERINLGDFSALHALSWHELFAALAIALLNIAAEEELLLTHATPRDELKAVDEWRILFKVSYWIQCAERAATYAQALQWGMQQKDGGLAQSNSVERAVSAQLSNRARIAALQRHAPTNKAVLALTRYFHEGNFTSLSEAVRQFCEHAPDAVRHLAPTNRHRTLREGLSKQLKSRRSPS